MLGGVPMKKIFAFSSALILGFCAFANVSQHVKVAKSTVEEDMAVMINKYINATEQYTKKTTIFLNNEAIDSQYFHAGHTVLKRTTYYGLDAGGNKALLMGDLEGGFATINSGYANDGLGNVIHFRTTGGLNCFEDATLMDVDYTITGQTMSDYFYDLFDIRNSIVSSEWELEGNIYSHEFLDLTVDENGQYNDVLLKKFQYFVAPMLLQSAGESHYLSPSSVQIEDVDGTLSIRLYALSDTGKLYSEGGLLAEARIYKGHIVPGYYLVGDFCEWQLLPQNRLSDTDDGTDYAKTLHFDIAKTGGVKAFEMKADGYPAWHGDGNNNVHAFQGINDVFASKDGNLYVDLVEAANVTYTFTCTNDYDIFDGHSVYFWSWPESGGGGWYSTTKIGSNQFTVILPSDCVYYIAVRMTETDEPDWSKEDVRTNNTSIYSGGSFEISFAFNS